MLSIHNHIGTCYKVDSPKTFSFSQAQNYKNFISFLELFMDSFSSSSDSSNSVDSASLTGKYFFQEDLLKFTMIDVVKKYFLKHISLQHHIYQFSLLNFPFDQVDIFYTLKKLEMCFRKRFLPEIILLYY